MPARSTAVLIAITLLAAVLAAGCTAGPQGRETRAGPVDAAGPHALLAKWHKALITGDKNTYISCFVGNDDEIVLALAGMEAVQANYAFHDAVVKQYGPDAWKSFTSGPAQIDIFPKDDTWTGRITVVRTGGAAVGYLPHARVPFTLVEDGGQWRLNAGSLVPPGLVAKQAADYQMRWAAAIRKLADQVALKQTPQPAASAANESFMKMVAPEERPAAARAVSDSFLMQ